MIWVNSQNVRHLPTPFGGTKASGIGRDGVGLRLLYGDEEHRDNPRHPRRAGPVSMSLYYVQKFLYELNRSPQLQEALPIFGVLEPYSLTDEEAEALTAPDIGKLYARRNGQILMHFAAFHQIEWQDYLQRMLDGIDDHGPGGRACARSPAMREPEPTANRSGGTEEWVMDPTRPLEVV